MIILGDVLTYGIIFEVYVPGRCTTYGTMELV